MKTPLIETQDYLAECKAINAELVEALETILSCAEIDQDSGALALERLPEIRMTARNALAKAKE